MISEKESLVELCTWILLAMVTEEWWNNTFGAPGVWLLA